MEHDVPNEGLPPGILPPLAVVLGPKLGLSPPARAVLTEQQWH